MTFVDCTRSVEDPVPVAYDTHEFALLRFWFVSDAYIGFCESLHQVISGV